jgi:hypothetical protein
MRRIPVLKNGIDVGLPGLTRGDHIIIELTHFLPIRQNLVEVISAYSFFCFDKFRSYSNQLFLIGNGYHFSEDESGYNPTKVSQINCRCIRRVHVFDPDNSTSIIAKVIFSLIQETKELTQRNMELSNLNAQLLLSHFNGSLEVN